MTTPTYDPLTPIGDPRILAQMTDEELMQRIQVGDEGSFNELFHRYARMTLSFSRRILGDLHSAENATQEAFLRIFREAEKYEYPRPFRTWLYALLRNVLKNELRRRERKEAPESSLAAVESPNDSREGPAPVAALASRPADRPEELLEIDEAQKKALEILLSLDEDDRECFFLHRFDGLKYKEIAVVMEVPVGTVRSRIHRVVATLQERLAEYL
ncbi:MAG TPA: RNA polymerase sigma factor [Planctomycetota bacterium]|nr:RNA polymerase sigma factor [Planctomycetota bacterium]